MSKKKKIKKTNAMRLLDSNNTDYKIYEYYVIDGKTDGISVAAQLGQNPNQVFKTLVTEGSSGENYVFVIPVNRELSLKKAAISVGEKSIGMINQRDLLGKTGYIHGGCSPIGMKKLYKTILDNSSENFQTIICSGGVRGLQIEVQRVDLLNIVHGIIADITT